MASALAIVSLGEHAVGKLSHKRITQFLALKIAYQAADSHPVALVEVGKVVVLVSVHINGVIAVQCWVALVNRFSSGAGIKHAVVHLHALQTEIHPVGAFY